MALFGKNKKDVEKDIKKVSSKISSEVETKEDTPSKTSAEAETKGEKVSKKQVALTKVTAGRDLASVIRKPRITEKAAMQTENNVYTFEICYNATKYDVRDAIKETFGVTPVKVNIVNKRTRHYTSRMRGRKMTDRQLKKAYVYLKDGDRIDLV